MVEKIKLSLAQDEEARKSKAPRGFAAKNRNNSILHNAAPRSKFDFTRVNPLARAATKHKQKKDSANSSIETDEDVVHVVPDSMEQDDSAKDSDSDEEEEEDSDCEVTDIKTKEDVLQEKIKEHIDLEEDDSEEEETVIL